MKTTIINSNEINKESNYCLSPAHYVNEMCPTHHATNIEIEETKRILEDITKQLSKKKRYLHALIILKTKGLQHNSYSSKIKRSIK